MRISSLQKGVILISNYQSTHSGQEIDAAVEVAAAEVSVVSINTWNDAAFTAAVPSAVEMKPYFVHDGTNMFMCVKDSAGTVWTSPMSVLP